MNESSMRAEPSTRAATGPVTTSLRALPVGWRSWEFRVLDGEMEIARLDLARFRTRGEYELAGVRYEVAREGLLASRYVLNAGGRVIARTERESLVPAVLRVVAQDRQLTLHSRLGLRSAFVIRHGDREIGSARRTSLFRRGFRIDVERGLPLQLTLFLLVIVLLTWRRRARAASGSGGG